MKLFFTDRKYYNKAKELLSKEIDTSFTLNNVDCFLLIIHGLPIENLDNLCISVSKRLNISLEEAYSLTQQFNPNSFKDIIFYEAINIILNGSYLGNSTDGKYNTSSWINHSVNEAILASNLALLEDLNPKFAFNYGLLHDYGRKYSHTFSHVTIGFEKLTDLGLNQEARACLTHSFINGGRYCCMETAPDDFHLTETGKEVYDDKDDLTELLEDELHTDYDDLLNVADLMAMSSGVVSPEIRIKDILTRRGNLEKANNWKYFLVSLYNLLLKLLNKMNVESDFKYIKYDEYSLEETKELLFNISNFFYSYYDKSIDSNIIEEKIKKFNGGIR